MARWVSWSAVSLCRAQVHRDTEVVFLPLRHAEAVSKKEKQIEQDQTSGATLRLRLWGPMSEAWAAQIPPDMA